MKYKKGDRVIIYDYYSLKYEIVTILHINNNYINFELNNDKYFKHFKQIIPCNELTIALYINTP